MDKQAGRNFNRPQYQKLIKRLKKDDALFIKSIDRLSRNYKEIPKQRRVIAKKKETDIVALDMPLLGTKRGKALKETFFPDIVLQAFSFVAENKRINIRRRQAKRTKAAKERGSADPKGKFLMIFRKSFVNGRK